MCVCVLRRRRHEVTEVIEIADCRQEEMNIHRVINEMKYEQKADDECVHCTNGGQVQVMLKFKRPFEQTAVRAEVMNDNEKVCQTVGGCRRRE